MWGLELVLDDVGEDMAHLEATSFIPQQVRAAGLDLKDVLTDIIENQF